MSNSTWRQRIAPHHSSNFAGDPDAPIEYPEREFLLPSIERHALTPDDLLYGLKPTTRLDAP